MAELYAMRDNSMQPGHLSKDRTGNSDSGIQFESEGKNSGIAEVLGKGAGIEDATDSVNRWSCQPRNAWR